MGRTKQGGSILGYVIVGGVLALLLLGGAYALRNYWSGKPAEVAKQPAATKQDEKKDTPPQAPAQTQAPSTQPAAPAAPSPSPSAGRGTQQLPQTGPADTLLSVAVLVIIIASLEVYRQSRRLVASL